MPSADVATSALTRLASRSSSACWRSAFSVLPGVRSDGVPALPQEGRHLLGGCHGEGVDDAGARQIVEMFGEPGHPVRGVRQPQHVEAQALPVERAAQDQGVGAAAGTELLGDVGRHPRVGRGGGGQHRDAGGQFGEHGAQTTVVGPEVVTPVGDAVRLVDHQEARGGGEPGQHLVAEVGVVEPLRTDQQHVDLARRDLGLDRLPLLGVGGVDRPRADTRAGGGLHLVAHQSEKRRDDHRGAGAPLAQQGGRDEVHRGLAPAGALHDQRSALVGHQRLDGAPLVLAQSGLAVLRADEPGQDGVGCRAQVFTVEAGRGVGGCGVRVFVGHGSMQPDGSDKPRTSRAACGQPLAWPWSGLSTGKTGILRSARWSPHDESRRSSPFSRRRDRQRGGRRRSGPCAALLRPERHV